MKLPKIDLSVLVKSANTEPAFEYPLGTVTFDIVTVLVVSLVTVANDEGETPTVVVEFPLVTETAPKLVIVIEPFQSAEVNAGAPV